MFANAHDWYSSRDDSMIDSFKWYENDQSEKIQNRFLVIYKNISRCWIRIFYRPINDMPTEKLLIKKCLQPIMTL